MKRTCSPVVLDSVTAPAGLGFDELISTLGGAIPVAPDTGLAAPAFNLYIEIDGPKRPSALGGRVLGLGGFDVLNITGNEETKEKVTRWDIESPDMSTHKVKRVEKRVDGVCIVVDDECVIVERLNVQL